MNGFELRALVWVIFMNRRFIPEHEADRVHTLYNEMVESASWDRAKADFTTLMTKYHGTRLSAGTTAIARRLVRLLARISPERFSYAMVKKRNWVWLATACTHFTCCYLIAHFSPGPTMPTLASVFFLLGLVSLIPTVSLFQAGGLIQRLERDDEPK